MRESVYLDSNVFIFPAIYSRKIPKATRAIEILNKVERKEIRAYTSALTWDEVVWVTLKVLGRQDAIEIGRKLISFPNLRFVEVNDDIISKAQLLIEKYRISPRDAIHCASALVKGIRKIITDDKDFDLIREVERIPL